MMQGPIRRLARDRMVRREDARLPSAWVGGEQPSGAIAGLSWLQPDGHTAAARVDHGSPVLVMLAREDGGAFNALVAHGDVGERVYVIVPPGWGKDQVDPRLLKSPRILVRRVPEVPVSGVHSATGARLWLGGKAGGLAPWSLRLDLAQTDAFRQVFLRLFWHEATEEAWTGGSQLAWRSAGERPFDVPDLPRTAPLRLLAPDARLEMDTQSALVHVASGAPPESTLRRLWRLPGGEHHERLSRLVRDGAQVLWEDRNLPDLMVGGNSGEILLPGSRARLRIVLTAAQAADAARVLEAPARWRFGVDLRLGDATHAGSSFWLPGESAARGLEPEQGVELPDVPSETLRAVPDTSPGVWPNPQPLALSVRYRWTVVPPRLPAGAAEDPLVGQWRKLDEEWMSRLGRVRDALQAAESDRGRIGRAFSLVGAMLGFERTHSGLLTEVASMQAQQPSAAGPGKAPAMFSRLAELEEQTKKHQGDLEEAERKAREDQEREKQKAAWQARVEAAKTALPRVRQELEAARTKRVETEATLKETESKFADASKSKEEKKDLKARKARLLDELERQDKAIRRLQGEIQRYETEAEEAFIFNPPSEARARSPQAAGRFIPASSAAPRSPTIPGEALPAVGELKAHRGQRYLVIELWDELDAGEPEARRLNARLVAPEKT